MPSKIPRREVLRLAKQLLAEDLSFKGYSILPNSCWMQGPPEVVARAEAAASLAKFRAGAAPAVPALIRLLADDNVCEGEDDCHYPWWRTVSDSAAAALVQIGRPAVPALIEALASQDNKVWWKAATVLGDIGPAATAAAPALAARLRADPQGISRDLIAQALRKVRANSPRRLSEGKSKRSGGRGKRA
jgi:HEAT repeat protein